MADYRNQIEIQKLSLGTDEMLNDIEQWEEYYICKAEIKTEQGNSFWQAQQMGYERSVNFYIRYCKKAREVTPIGYRIKYRDDIYDIISADTIAERNDEVRIKAVVKK